MNPESYEPKFTTIMITDDFWKSISKKIDCFFACYLVIFGFYLIGFGIYTNLTGIRVYENPIYDFFTYVAVYGFFLWIASIPFAFSSKDRNRKNDSLIS